MTSTANSTANSIERKSPFASFSELTNAHLLLSEELETSEASDRPPSPADDARLFDRIGDFLDRSVATGVIVESASERRGAQGLIDYWATILRERSNGQKRPATTLLRFDPEQAPELPDALCPYVGLDSFDEQTASYFFGRSELVQQLTSELADNRLVILIGPSGSGKSSVVRAGLLPRLRQEGLFGQRIEHFIEMLPGQKPHFPSLAADSSTLLFIDQFEEIFTLCDSPALRQAFLDELQQALHQPALRVVMTMRSDFESYLAKHDALYQQAKRVPVPPLSATALRAAIDKPAAAVGLIYGPGVIDALLSELLGEPAGLPLLQFTLLRLWKDKQRNRVTMEVYKKVGGGRQALARHADEVFEKLPNEKKETAKRILLRLGRPLEGYGVEVMRSRIRLKELFATREDPQRIIEVVQKFVAEGLLRKSGAANEPLEEHQIEIAHEALVRNWPRLVEWLDGEKLEIEKRRRWEALLGEWRRLGMGKNGLLEAVQLQELIRWLDSPAAITVGYDTELERLKDASARHLQAEKSRSDRRIRIVIGGLIALLCVNVGFSIIAVRERRKADRSAKEARHAEIEQRKQRDLAEKREIDIYVEQGRELLLSDNPLRAALWLQAAYQRGPDNLAVRYLLAWALRPIDAMRQTLVGHEKGLRDAAWSPDGRSVVTVGDDLVGRVFDASSGTLKFPLRGHSDLILSATYSPDGARIATASWDGTLRLWDATSGAALKELKVHSHAVWSVQFSPSGRRIITASADGTARVFDAESSRLLVEIKGRGGWVMSASYSPDSRHIVTASSDGTAAIFDATNGKFLLKLDHQGRSLSINTAAWSPDGHRVVIASRDNIARVFDAETGVKLIELVGHSAAIGSAAYSPDGERIVTASEDKTARIFDANNGRLLAVLLGHLSGLRSAAFSPDGHRVVTASTDQTARIFDADSDRLLAELRGLQAVYSPDGRRVATASLVDKVARIWNAETGWLLRELVGHSDGVWSVAYRPDGRRVVTASADKLARVYDVETGRLLLSLPGHTNQVRSAAYSPDGRRIVTASWDHTARIFDAETGAALVELKGHDKELSSAVYSPDGRHILTASKDHTARIFDADSGQMVRTLLGHGNVVWSAVYSPDGRHILTASSDQTARVWDAETGQLITELNGHVGAVLSASYSGDGQRIVTAGADQTTRVFEAESGRLLFELSGFLSRVWSAAYSPSGQRLVTATSGFESAQIWDAAPEERSPEEIAQLLRCRLPYRLDRANIVLGQVDMDACAKLPPSHVRRFSRSSAAYWAGIYAFRRGDKEGARARFIEDLELTRRAAEPVNEQGSLLVQMLLNSGGFDSPQSQSLFAQALALQKKLEPRQSDSEATWNTLQQLLIQAQKRLYLYEGAIAVAQRMLKVRDKDPSALRAQQIALLSLGRFDEVLRDAPALLLAERVGDTRSRCMDLARAWSAARMRNSTVEMARLRPLLIAEYKNLSEDQIVSDESDDLREGLSRLTPQPPHLAEVFELFRLLERRKSDESSEDLETILSGLLPPNRQLLVF